MIPVWLFLFLLGLPATVAGGRIAFDVRGAATAMVASQQRAHELRAAAAGDLAPPARWITAFGFRALYALLGLVGVALLLGGVAELLTAG